MSISKYPIDVSDSEGIAEAVNYLLSGPAGLGQNFQGFSAYVPAYLRPSNRQPWDVQLTSGLNTSLYLALPISDIQPVGALPSALITVTFATPQATPPFQFGDRVDIFNVTEAGTGDTSLNGSSDVVYSCTTTEVVVGYNADFDAQDWDVYISGGTIGRDYLNVNNETDCNARVTVSGATQQVFVTAQINLAWTYTCAVASTYNVSVRIFRLEGFESDTPGSQEYIFSNETLVSKKDNYFAVTPGSGTQTLETIFSTVLDGPNLPFKYYWYILQVYFEVEGPLYDDSETLIPTGTKAVLGSVTTYSSISPATITGTGSGAVIDVELDASGAGIPYLIDTNTYITITNFGANYKPGDTLLVLGTDLGGASPANDMTLTVQYVGPPYDVEIGPVITGLRSLTAQVIKE
jgi:hypothetical protein